MALVYPNEKSPSFRTWGTLTLSTSADGVTGADILDCTGLTLNAMQPSTACSSACTYTLKGSIDGSSNLGNVLGSSGVLTAFGSTATDPRGAVITFDPAFFAGLRFIQVVSNTTSAAAPNATGATMKMFLTAGPQPR